MRMKDKIVKLNMNIEILVENILKKEMEYINQGYCPYPLQMDSHNLQNDKNDNCDDCSKCKLDYINKLRSDYLTKYQIG